MLRTEPTPLTKDRLFQTFDLDEARAIVAGKFCDHRLDIAGDVQRFDARHHRAEGHLASLNYIQYGADVVIDPGELESFYLVQIPLTGHADIDNSAGMVETGNGIGSILNPHRHTKMRWREGCTQILLQIDAKALQDEAERLLGAALSEPVTFDTAIDERRPETAQWVQKLKTCFNLAEQNAVFSQRTTGTQIRVEQELIADLLRSQPNSLSAQMAVAPSTVSNVHLRRAVRFMMANLGNQITMADISDAAGITARSLQLYFQDQFDMSPMRFLKQQRLRRARALIEYAQDDTSVGDIAFRVGLTHLGRFSGEYRTYYGETPRDTLIRVLANRCSAP